MGILHGKPFKPNERQKKILTESAMAGKAMAKANSFHKRFDSTYYRSAVHWKYLLMLNHSRRLEAYDNHDECVAYTYKAVSVSKAMLGKVPGLDQAKRFVASCIIRPIGKFRGHDRSASLKSN